MLGNSLDITYAQTQVTSQLYGKPKRKQMKTDGDLEIEPIETPDNEMIKTPEEVPEGWMTVRQISQAAGYSETWTYRKVLRLIEVGEAEKRQFRINTGQRTMPVTHYHITCDI